MSVIAVLMYNIGIEFKKEEGTQNRVRNFGGHDALYTGPGRSGLPHGAWVEILPETIRAYFIKEPILIIDIFVKCGENSPTKSFSVLVRHLEGITLAAKEVLRKVSIQQ